MSKSVRNIRVRARSHAWSNDVELLVLGVQQGKTVSGVDVIVAEVEEGKTTSPTLNIDKLAAQGLMDDLWLAGLRPTEGTGSAGSLAATQKHLNDMRRIVEKQLDIKF